jgi:molybdopterin-guanine dinucleotide biosynthesis adapter protein
MTPPLFGIVGWKNSGKTTLVSRLIAELTRRGMKVAAVKHAHHGFDVDQPGRDSYKFRESGAREVAVISDRRVLVEGFKRHDHAKIEVRRREAVQQDAMGDGVPGVVAIASDHAVEPGALPVFALDDIAGMVDFILRQTRLTPKS